nr:hypothetical protein HEP84_11375 [Streptomyces sp. RLB1-33]
MGGDDAAEEMIRMRHYTNSRGKAGIVQGKVIRASDQNNVFLVPAKGKPMSPRDAEGTLGIGRGRGKSRARIRRPGRPGSVEIQFDDGHHRMGR